MNNFILAYLLIVAIFVVLILVVISTARLVWGLWTEQLPTTFVADRKPQPDEDTFYTPNPAYRSDDDIKRMIAKAIDEAMEKWF